MTPDRLSPENREHALDLVRLAIVYYDCEGLPRFTLEKLQDATMTAYKMPKRQSAAWCLRLIESLGCVRETTRGVWELAEPKRKFWPLRIFSRNGS